MIRVGGRLIVAKTLRWPSQSSHANVHFIAYDKADRTDPRPVHNQTPILGANQVDLEIVYILHHSKKAIVQTVHAVEVGKVGAFQILL